MEGNDPIRAPRWPREWPSLRRISSPPTTLQLGQFDESKIDVIGAQVADVTKPYHMHPDIDRELVTPQHGPYNA
jgi:hypothetical protein